MEEKVTIAGIEIPSSPWEQTPTSVKEVVTPIEGRLTNIKERLGLTSKNSSQKVRYRPKKERSTVCAQAVGLLFRGSIAQLFPAHVKGWLYYRGIVTFPLPLVRKIS